MSYRVTDEFLSRSRSKHGTRMVGSVIAEVAHHDGIGWLLQAPSTAKQRRGKKQDTIAGRANLSPRQVGRAVERLQDLDELEVVIAWDGRVSFYVYRLIVGSIRLVEPDTSRGLPMLEGQFWTVEQLELRPWERPVEGHVLTPAQAQERDDILSGRLPGDPAADDPTSATGRSDILSPDEPTSPPGNTSYARARGSRKRSSEPSLTSSAKTTEDVAAEAADQPDLEPPVRQLIRAFAETVGCWPNGRSEWGGWARAFKPLADANVTPDELRITTAAYLERFPEYDRGPFALTKIWQQVQAALERSYFGLYRWIIDVSWRLPAEDVAWVIDTAGGLTDDQRRTMHDRAREARAARTDPIDAFLTWVEHQGFALDDDDWRRELDARTAGFGTRRRDIRIQANDRRKSLRHALARLDLGLPAEGAA